MESQTRDKWSRVIALGEQGVGDGQVRPGTVAHEHGVGRIDLYLTAGDDTPNRARHVVECGGERMFWRQAVLDPHDVDIEGVAYPSAQRIALAGIAEREAAPVELKHHRSG